MAFDFTRYQPPGVYVEDTSLPIIGSGGVPQAVACLVGPAIGYQHAVETVLINDTAGAVLTYRGIFTDAVAGPPPIAAPVVTKIDGTALVEETDYTFTVDSSSDSGAVTTIKRVSSSTNVANNDAVIVDYSYADATYYQPQVHTDPDTLFRVYGAPLVSVAPTNPNDSQVSSPLALAAQIAFENGAGTLITVATNPADGDLKSQLKAAYAKVATSYSAALICPVFPDDLSVSSGSVSDLLLNYAQDLETHCVSASNSGFNRIGFFGVSRNYDETAKPMEVLAAGIANKRIVLMYPTRFQLFNGSTTQIAEVSGCYAAAAAAGLLSALPVNMPLTRKTLSSFAGLPSPIQQKMTKLFKDNLSANGVCVAEISRTGALTVRHGLTTDMSALTTREISLVRIPDALYEQVQLGMENAGLIGQPIDGEMVMRVKGALQSILEAAVSNETIVSYTNLTAQQQIPPSGDPSIISCSFSYQPAIPLNYITVSFQIDLNSGAVAETTTTAPAAA